MKVTEVRVGYGVTVNLGDYQSARIDAGATAQLGPAETIEGAARELFIPVRRAVLERARPLLAREKTTIERVFMDLPPALRDEMIANDPLLSQSPE